MRAVDPDDAGLIPVGAAGGQRPACCSVTGEIGLSVLSRPDRGGIQDNDACCPRLIVDAKLIAGCGGWRLDVACRRALEIAVRSGKGVSRARSRSER